MGGLTPERKYMINYIYGKVIYINKNFLILENGGIGYKIRIIRSENYKIDEFVRVYIHEVKKLSTKNTISSECYGFLNSHEKQLFVDLLTISGVGVIIASNLLKHGYKMIINAIVTNNIEVLKQIRLMNTKIAATVINELNEKYAKYAEVFGKGVVNEQLNDLILALQQLGYTRQQIDLAITKSEQGQALEEMIKNAIKTIAEVSDSVQS